MTARPGDAAILARLDFTPKCPIGERHACGQPDLHCDLDAVIVLRIHDCRSNTLESVIACTKHATALANSLIPWLARAQARGNRCPGCGLHFTSVQQVLNWEEL